MFILLFDPTRLLSRLLFKIICLRNFKSLRIHGSSKLFFVGLGWSISLYIYILIQITKTIKSFLQILSPSMNNFKIIHWNVNGIIHKLSELKYLISKHNIDIILLSETRLSPVTNLKIWNFHTYRTSLPPKHSSPDHGGTAILVH